MIDPEDDDLLPDEDNEEENDITDSSADISSEDLSVLGLLDGELGSGEDDVLIDRVYPLDFTGEDLDVPGTELDDAEEATGNEDEENNLYSLGG